MSEATAEVVLPDCRTSQIIARKCPSFPGYSTLDGPAITGPIQTETQVVDIPT